MKNRLNRVIATLATLAVLATCVAPFPVSAQGNQYSFTVNNTSSFALYEVHFSPSYTTSWPSDSLGRRQVIASGASLTFTDLRPGEYDVKLVDEDGDACIIWNQKIFQNMSLRVTDSWLLSCEAR